MPSVTGTAAALGAAGSFLGTTGGNAAMLGGSSILSSGIGALASLTAGNKQASTAQFGALLQAEETNKAQKLIKSMYAQNKELLTPFVGAGESALTQLQDLTGTNAGGNPMTAPLTAPFQPTMEQLAQTPGYQFALQQGELATSNAFSSQGLGGSTVGGVNGPSGALGKGLAQYAEGLASTTYEQQFQNYLAQHMQTYSMLAGQVNAGLGAAGTLAGAATSAGSTGANTLLTGGANIGSYLTAGTAASAAGLVGAGNSLAGGLQGAGSSYLLAGLLNNNNTGAYNYNNANTGGGFSAGLTANQLPANVQ